MTPLLSTESENQHLLEAALDHWTQQLFGQLEHTLKPGVRPKASQVASLMGLPTYMGTKILRGDCNVEKFFRLLHLLHVNQIDLTDVFEPEFGVRLRLQQNSSQLQSLNAEE